MKLNYLIIISSVLIVLWLMANASIYLFQESLIFQAGSVADDLAYNFRHPVKEVFVERESNARVHALHFANAKPKGVIFYFHGNRGDLSRWGVYADDFLKYNYDLFMMDYRGYGKSTGVRSEENIFGDARVLVNQTLEQNQYDRVIYFGRSLGSGVAVQLASEKSPDLLILETPFSQLSDAIRGYKFLLADFVLSKYPLASIDKTAGITAPVCIIHGTKDVVVPYKYGKKLFDAFMRSKKIVKIPGGRHNNLNSFALYHETLKELLNDWTHEF